MSGMLERGHYLAEQVATRSLQEAINEARTDDAVTATRHLIAITRIRAFTERVLVELEVPDIRLEGSTPLLPSNLDADMTEKIKSMSFGAILQYFRTQARLSYKDLSNRTDLNSRYLSRLENGWTKKLRITTVIAIIWGFGWNEQDQCSQLLLEKSGRQHRTRTPKS